MTDTATLTTEKCAHGFIRTLVVNDETLRECSCGVPSVTSAAARQRARDRAAEWASDDDFYATKQQLIRRPQDQGKRYPRSKLDSGGRWAP